MGSKYISWGIINTTMFTSLHFRWWIGDALVGEGRAAEGASGNGDRSPFLPSAMRGRTARRAVALLFSH